MSKLTWKPGAVLAPVPPTLVTCGQGETANLLTVAWAGIVCTQPPMTYISVRPSRHSYKLLTQTGEFAVNLPPASLARRVDLCGVKSGAQCDKWALSGLTPAPASVISAPLVAQCPIHLECRVRQVIPLGSHHMFLADIVAVDVEEALVDEKGRLMIEKCNLLAYAHGSYFELRRALGTFGFSVRKRKPKNRPKKEKPKKELPQA